MVPEKSCALWGDFNGQIGGDKQKNPKKEKENTDGTDDNAA
jgi:hypothetical protein